jgi:hypothetical protein
MTCAPQGVVPYKVVPLSCFPFHWQTLKPPHGCKARIQSCSAARGFVWFFRVPPHPLILIIMIYIYITMLVGNFLHYFIASWGLPSTMSRWTQGASFKHSQPYPATTPKVVNTNKLCTRLVCLPKSNWQIWAFKLSKNQPMHQMDTKTDLRVHFYSPEAWPDPSPSGTPKGSMFGSCLDEIEISWLGNMTKCYWEVGKRLFYT